MGEGPAKATANADATAKGTSVRPRRSFSIERHLRKAEGAEMAFDVAAGAETGTLRALLEEIRGLRGEVGDLRTQIGALTAKPDGGGAAPAKAPPGPCDHFHEEDLHKDDAAWKREAQILRIEVARMVRSLAATKREIAEIKHPLNAGDEDRMTKAASELDEIVSATEDATNDILDASEAIGTHANEILAEIGDLDTMAPRLQDINEQVARIMEACNFQDITGQRVTKVVKTLEFIEDRIRTIVEDWGREAFLDLPLPDDSDATGQEDDESKLLNGPQLANQGLSQDDIDALFD
jgi:chemotaxis protein CheZ